MSYCRFQGKSDVYMIATDDGCQCVACRLIPPELFYSELVQGITQCRTTLILDTLGEALRHLYDHISAGHYVPKYAIRRLKREMKEQALREHDPETYSQKEKNTEDWQRFWMSIPDEVWEDTDKLLKLIEENRG